MIYDFQPGDGTRYNLVTVDDPHGGVLVICNNSSLWRYHAGDQLKFLCGNENEYTRRAIFNHLESEEEECDHHWVARTPFAGPVTRMFCTKCKLHRMKEEFE